MSVLRVDCKNPAGADLSQGLNVTVVSYMGRVDVGFVADPDRVDDVWALAEQVPAALAELVEAVEKETEAPVVNGQGKLVA